MRRMSERSWAISFWSLADSLIAADVFCCVLPMSAVSSLHFLTRRVSDSCDFLSAR